LTLDRNRPWPDEDIRTLIDGKAEGLIGRAIAARLNTSRSEKAIERKWERVRTKILAGKSPYKSGEIVDIKVLSQAIDNMPGDRANHPSTEGMEVEQKDNILQVDSRSRRIKTLEDLIIECEIDLDEWRIERHVINKWEVGAKLPNEYGEMEIVTSPLFQVKAWLVKKEPIAIEPVVSPVTLTVVRERKKPKASKVSDLKLAMTLPDPQVGFHKSLRTGKLTPFHDRGALDVALQIAQDYKFDKTIYLGDLLDLAEFTDKFVRSPNYYWSTQPAAIEAKWWMTQFRDADPEGEQYALEGNHDERLKNHMLKHFKVAYGLRSVDNRDLPRMMTIPRILALHDIDVEWVPDYPNGEVWINDQLACEHGAMARAKSGATVSAMAVDAQVSRIFGHTHRLEMASKTVFEKSGGRQIEIWSMGCLCRVDGTVPGVKARQNWQQAVGFIEYTDGGEHTIQGIKISNGEAIFRGKRYVARDRMEQLRDETADTKADWQW
jgi:hypothetical protein